MPVELSRDTLAAIQAQRPDGVETELFAFGRLPLALSARCFTARAHKLPKDDCQYRCLDYPDGMLLSTQEDERFLTLNGIQTQSARTYTLLAELDDISRLGVDVLRISPQSRHTPQIIQAFADVLNARRDYADAHAELTGYMPAGPCDGYWAGRSGMSWGGLSGRCPAASAGIHVGKVLQCLTCGSGQWRLTQGVEEIFQVQTDRGVTLDTQPTLKEQAVGILALRHQQ